MDQAENKINGLSAQHGRKSTIPYSERALHLTNMYTRMKRSSSCVLISRMRTLPEVILQSLLSIVS